MLDNLQEDSSIQEDGDFLGGGTFLLESGVYDMVIDMAYLDTSKGGATSLTLHLKGKNGENVRETFWITSGTAKGCKNYYLDKDGNKKYLPGFSQANSICKLATGKSIAEIENAKKVVKVYDFTAKKEVPQEKTVLTGLLDQPITVGVIKQTVDKNVKNAEGNYVPSGETREENFIDKAFRTSDHKTSAEIIAQADDATFYDKWVAKNTGTVRNKAIGPTMVKDIPEMGSGKTNTAESTSLFG